MFAVAVIGGVAVLTGTAVALLFPQSSQSVADPAPAISATEEQPVLTASLDPVFPPVRKVVTKTYPALKADELPAPKADAPAANDGLPAPRPVKLTSVKPADEPGGKPVVEATVPTAAAPQAEPVIEAAAAPGDRVKVDGVDAAASDALAPQDPRWARSDAGAADGAFVTAIPPATGGDAAAAAGKSDDQDQTTAAISPDDVRPKKSVKSTKQTDDDDATADDTPVAPGVSGSTRPAQVNRGVNMRSRGRSGASVVMTIPRSAVVQVVGCKAWCEIIYKGQRGYIYKDFLGGASKRVAVKKSKAKVASDQPATATDAKTVYLVDSVNPDTTKTDSTGSVDQGQQRKITSQHAQ